MVKRLPYASIPSFTAPSSIAKVPLPLEGDAAAIPVAGNAGAFVIGDSGSETALNRIELRTDQKTQHKALKHLKDALKSLKRNDWADGGAHALKALRLDERNAVGWHMLAISQEKTGQLEKALDSFQKALSYQPHSLPIANDLGRLAYKLKHLNIAEKFFSYVLKFAPHDSEASNNLATALRDMSRFEDAIEILRNAIHYDPENAILWNALGTVVNARGDTLNAKIFYSEAIRFAPDMALPSYNLSNILRAEGKSEESLRMVQHALEKAESAEVRNMCALSLAFTHATLQQLDKAWDCYAGRKSGGTDQQFFYIINRPEWTPETDVQGKHIFISGEQGLGDEILFASVLPDLIQDIGSEGKLTLAVEPRLVSLFARSFPQATVIDHLSFTYQQKKMRGYPRLSEPETIDYWTLMAELLRKYRPSLEAFPSENSFLKPDPQRVDYWKNELAKLGNGPKIGILWKSLIKHSQRDRYYSPFDQWKSVIQTPGTFFINLQYGDSSTELAQAEREGLRIWNPPNIDLTKDLDDLCALCLALDLVIAPPNATSNMAAAAGTKTWFISSPNSWVRLGTDHYPWYPTVRSFEYRDFNWARVMADIQNAITLEFGLTEASVR
ncbi:MAG: tetratricopeptide repeat protein [Asticcacaulis sp.]